jgi:hypothetical protein
MGTLFSKKTPIRNKPKPREVKTLTCFRLLQQVDNNRRIIGTINDGD